MLTFAPLVAGAQTPAKIYTKKMRMADFPTAVTKVVLSSQSMFELAVREEIISRWNSSPYEFCSVQDYEALKTNNSFYFLRLITKDGVIFMDLSKGGVEGEKDMLRKPFDVVSIPIGTAGVVTGHESALLGAFVDIIQQFAKESMESDVVGYTGMDTYNKKDFKGKYLALNVEEAYESLEDRTPGTLAGIVIAPAEINFESWCYKMLIDAENHELYYYSRERYKDKSDSKFSDKEVSRFVKRNASVSR